MSEFEGYEGAIIGRSHEGRPLIGERFGSEGPVALVVCGIHGDEPSSVAFGERLRSRLLGGRAGEMGVRVALVPVANPDGLAAGSRSNARGVDLNRNFAASNFESGGDGSGEPFSERETRALRNLVEAVEPDAIYAIHCCEPLFDWDGPARHLAEVMAESLPDDVPFPAEKLGANPGSLGSWAGIDRGIPVVTVEFDCHGDPDIRRQLDAVQHSFESALQRMERAGSGASNPTAALQDLSVDNHYLASRLTGSSPARLEIVGPSSEQRPLLLIGGAERGDRSARLVAESLRRRLLHRTVLERPVASITRLPGDTDRSWFENVLDQVEPAFLIYTAADTVDGYATYGLDESRMGGEQSGLERCDLPSSPLLDVCRQRGVPGIRFAVSSDHAEGRDATDVPSARRFIDVMQTLE